MSSTGHRSSVGLSALVSDGVVYGLARVVASVASAFLVPVYTRSLTLSDYGAIENLNILLALLPMITSFSLYQHFYLAGNDTEADPSRDFSTLLVLASLIGLGVAVLAWPARRDLSWLLFSTTAAERATDAWLVVLTGALMGPLSLFLTLMQLRRLRRGYLLNQLGSVTIVLLLNCLLVGWAHLGVRGFVVSGLVAQLWGLGTAWYFCRPGFSPHLVSGSRFLPAMTYAAAFVPGGLALFVMRSSDRFFLTQLVPGGLDLVAVYALAEKLSLPIGLAAAALNLAYPAHGIRMEQDPSSARDVFRYFMTGSVFVGFLCVITSPWLIRLLATPSYAASADYVPYLTTYLTLNGLVVIPSLYLTRKGLARVVLVITFSAGALNLALNALLIPVLGIHGAAASTVMTYVFYCGWVFREARLSGLVADSVVGWLLLAFFLVGGVAGVNEPVALLAVGIGLVVIVVAGGLLDRRDLLRVRSSLARLFPRLQA